MVKKLGAACLGCLLMALACLADAQEASCCPQAADGLCEAALEVPKVALLFLAVGALWHEPTWEAWFRHAAGVVPLEPLRTRGCNATQLEAVLQHCCQGQGTCDVLAAQHLFDVHVHTMPDFPGFEEGSIFHGREITDRVEVKWGTHTLYGGGRQLFKAALANPRAQRFALLSDSCIPLYPPTLVWQQLMSETKSRINACRHSSSSAERWNVLMERGEHRIPREAWRKSSQWISLLRSHAELLVKDTAIEALFQQDCAEVNGGGSVCFSEEHYPATLLAYLGKEQETDCHGYLVKTDWSRGGPHPHSFAVEDVDAERIRLLRMPDLCQYSEALRLIKQGFVAPGELSADACKEDVLWADSLLDFHCPLFARKFSSATAARVHATLTDCSNGLDVAACDDDTRGPWRALRQLPRRQRLWQRL